MTPSSADLELVLNFTESDLCANRDGRLSAAQAAKLNQDKKRIALIASGLFVAFVLVSTALLFVGQNSKTPIAFGGGFLLILANALTIGILGREYMRLDSDQRCGTVVALAGQVERVIRRGKRSDSFVLRIEGEDIIVARELLDCFEHMLHYRIYRTRRSNVLLSAELLT